MRIATDVWLISLRAAGDADHDCLDEAERARADRFKFEHHRRRFQRAHTAQRRILGRYCQLEPRAIRYDIAAQGKPRLSGDFAWNFNMSHSEELALLAVYPAAAVDLGVDVERLRSLPDRDSLAARYFSAAERRELSDRAGESAQDQAFLCCWTRKEAYVKALGTGLGEGELRDMEVGLSGRVRVGAITIDPLQLPSEFIGAIACSEETGPVRYREFAAEFADT